MKYERLLVARAQDDSRHVDGIDLSLLIGDRHPEVYTEVTEEIKKSEKSKDSEPAPTIRALPTKPSTKGDKGKGKGGKTPSPPSNPPPKWGSQSYEKKHVCFWHDPKNNKTCRYGKSCPDEHLDTRKERESLRYQGAMRASKGSRY